MVGAKDGIVLTHRLKLVPEFAILIGGNAVLNHDSFTHFAFLLKQTETYPKIVAFLLAPPIFECQSQLIVLSNPSYFRLFLYIPMLKPTDHPPFTARCPAWWCHIRRGWTALRRRSWGRNMILT